MTEQPKTVKPLYEGLDRSVKGSTEGYLAVGRTGCQFSGCWDDSVVQFVGTRSCPRGSSVRTSLC